MEIYTYVNILGRVKSISSNGYIWMSNCHDQPQMEHTAIFLDGTSTVEGTCRFCGKRSNMYPKGENIKRFELIQNLIGEINNDYHQLMWKSMITLDVTRPKFD